ncbi:hypothetical protein F5144DRAFT_608788 [Chaetomium tenue]|uniref:Uncharacterized protein n=1 Tax=Chaetomium tenue TaxID=1854479 RepID=A0ACB7PNY8_9PEZI|nr:hypothetical protein F5144DRAFT_608788 [Chaetomium globosum]
MGSFYHHEGSRIGGDGYLASTATGQTYWRRLVGFTATKQPYWWRSSPKHNPKVLPWLAAVERPEGSPFVSDGSCQELFFSCDDTSSTGTSHSERINLQNEHTTNVTHGLGLQLTEFGKIDPPTCCSTANEPDGIDNQSSLSSTSDYLDEGNIASIGSYAVEKLFGPGIEAALHRQQLEEAVENFVEELVALKLKTEGTRSWVLWVQFWRFVLEKKGQRRRWRRFTIPTPKEGDDDGDDGDNGDASRRNSGGDGPPGNSKSPDPEKSLTLEFMCPYRLKDPIRFNVREWYDCATKVYICEGSGSKRNELNELRRHIKQRHSGPGILSPHYCSTCKEEFPSPTLLDEHAKQGDTSEVPSPGKLPRRRFEDSEWS